MAWFDAPSLTAGAELVARVGGLDGILLDLRPGGVRARVRSDEQAAAVSAAANDLGLAADPSALQRLSVVVDSTNPVALQSFWRWALAYEAEGEALRDPLRRDPDLRFGLANDERPLRNRVHVDIVRPAAAIEQTGLGAGTGPWDLCHADPDGNEIDLVPGDPVDGAPDWHEVFAAVACYRTTSVGQQVELVRAAARLADAAGFPLLIDVRPGLVVLDSGKDLADADAHGLEVDVRALAAELQAAARDLGATPDPALPRFVQLFLDAADVEALRAFWAAALGYAYDRRAGVNDIVDPRRLNPVIGFQRLADDPARRAQRNRIVVELAVPADAASGRVEAMLAAGGRLLGEEGGRHRIADPEDNELVVVSAR